MLRKAPLPLLALYPNCVLFDADDRAVQDDRAALAEERQSLLNRKHCSSNVQSKVVSKCFRWSPPDSFNRPAPAPATSMQYSSCLTKPHIKPVEIGVRCHLRNAGDVVADYFTASSSFSPGPVMNTYAPFFHEQFCRRERARRRDYRHLVIELTDSFPPFRCSQG